jgi:hypothetical protein
VLAPVAGEPLDALHTAITSFIERRNADPNFRRTKSADDVLASIERFWVRNLWAAQGRQRSSSNKMSCDR